ncbi:LGFP repeat-containing protein [Nocardia seriolae]|uniref:Esterase n=1 Tax=Nocardia seriolae TaxID=37332 RepID=A0A0B8N7P8_9NOCA|nr:esterase [Nocardia seriolae]APA95899.1 Serine-type D-Ala-D-Ala carboxypeptidase [Nocardia seriolae]MTJ66001.1 esterase [Nocardia seriolae]MTJ75641.1 esterase [Nocardia seriolae]MTJ86075.1 esterase [Nocardia seriolae]MTK30070.1 esterase [Nocardia seriolae]
MHHFARRTAGLIAALAVVTALGAGCDKDKDKNSASATTTTAAATETHTAETKISTPNGEITVAGGVLEKYNQMGGATSPLGMPTGPAKDAPDGGMVQEFDGGAIYSSPTHGTHVVWGEIRKAWEENGGATGKLGYPTSDEFDIAGGKQSDFSGGSITWIDNKTTVTEK